MVSGVSRISPEEMARRIRRAVIRHAHRAGVGHIGCALSVADIVATLHAGALALAGGEGAQRDRFILSKGHAALALYAALHETGRLPDLEPDGYLADGTALGVHPSHLVTGIEFSTGSLGYGPGFGAGCAWAARLRGESWRTVVLVSDAECAEGSVWEAAAFAAEHRLAALTVIVDVNGRQALGPTPAQLGEEALAKRWAACGWETCRINGHDCGEIAASLGRPGRDQGAPRVVLARTVFGCGVSFMEGSLDWHYLPLTAEQHRQACGEVEGR